MRLAQHRCLASTASLGLVSQIICLFSRQSVFRRYPMPPRNLWGSLPGSTDIRPPVTILKEQAEVLSEISGGILYGKVLRESGGGRFAFTLQIEAPAINYTYEVLQADHGLDFYPVSSHLGILPVGGSSSHEDSYRPSRRRWAAVGNAKRFPRSVGRCGGQGWGRSFPHSVSWPPRAPACGKSVFGSFRPPRGWWWSDSAANWRAGRCAGVCARSSWRAQTGRGAVVAGSIAELRGSPYRRCPGPDPRASEPVSRSVADASRPALCAPASRSVGRGSSSAATRCDRGR